MVCVSFITIPSSVNIVPHLSTIVKSRISIWDWKHQNWTSNIQDSTKYTAPTGMPVFVHPLCLLKGEEDLGFHSQPTGIITETVAPSRTPKKWKNTVLQVTSNAFNFFHWCMLRPQFQMVQKSEILKPTAVQESEISKPRTVQKSEISKPTIHFGMSMMITGTDLGPPPRVQTPPQVCIIYGHPTSPSPWIVELLGLLDIG